MNFDASLRAALESHLVALRLADAGTRSDVSAEATGYRRADGSFVADGFFAGDTILAAGFSEAGNDGAAILRAVSDTELTVERALTPEAAGSPVSIVATLPAARKFDGQPFVRPADAPWLRVALRPVAGTVAAFGAGGVLRHRGTLLVDLFEPVANGFGLARLERLAAGLRGHFQAGGAIPRDGLAVRILGMRRGAVQEARDFVSLPLSIEWFCDAAN